MTCVSIMVMPWSYDVMMKRTGAHPSCSAAAVSSSASVDRYDDFEQMHYVCFHYEFEHKGDPDVECAAGGCPAAGVSVPAARLRFSGHDLVQAGNTVVRPILALESLGNAVT